MARKTPKPQSTYQMKESALHINCKHYYYIPINDTLF